MESVIQIRVIDGTDIWSPIPRIRAKETDTCIQLHLKNEDKTRIAGFILDEYATQPKPFRRGESHEKR
jgi:hypothetical protein